MATTIISTLSLHDALPIYDKVDDRFEVAQGTFEAGSFLRVDEIRGWKRVRISEEHTSELQSRGHIECRLLLEKKYKEIIEEDNILVHINNYNTKEASTHTT